jgi:hypothetical protein
MKTARAIRKQVEFLRGIRAERSDAMFGALLWVLDNRGEVASPEEHMTRGARHAMADAKRDAERAGKGWTE